MRPSWNIFAATDAALYFNNTLSEIVLGDGATLMHYRVQEESRSAWHLSSLYLSQAQHSRYRGTTLAFGGAWSRTDYNAHFMHAGAECDLNGLYTVGDRQLTDFHLDVQHSVPGCRSRERFKGILYGKGRAVFDGRILVDKQAQLSDAQLTNDNLMLTRDAEVDTKPQLEIYADDVKCSHGTTVGQLDPDAGFLSALARSCRQRRSQDAVPGFCRRDNRHHRVASVTRLCDQQAGGHDQRSGCRRLVAYD